MIRGFLGDQGDRHRARIAALELAGELGEPGDQAELRRRIWPVPCPCGAKVGRPCKGDATIAPGWHTSRWNEVFSLGAAIVSQESERVYRDVIGVPR